MLLNIKSLWAYFDNQFQPGAGSGVLVGTLVDDSYHVIFVAETPSEEEEREQQEEGEKERPQQRELDVSWLAEHAKQVLRLLPGEQAASSNRD